MKDPKVTSSGQKELDKVEKQFDAFDKNVQELTLDRMNMAPKEEKEPLAKLSQKDLEKAGDVYLKPFRSIGSQERFNESYREEYNFSKEYVRFIPENKEIIGETIDVWTKPFAGLPAEWWKVPVGKPVWGPRYLAERLAGCKYHRLVMRDKVTTGSDSVGEYYGVMAADTVIQRLDAIPVSTRKSVFMSENDFQFSGRKTA